MTPEEAEDATYFLLGTGEQQDELLLSEEEGYRVRRELLNERHEEFIELQTLEGAEEPFLLRRSQVMYLYLSTPEQRAWYQEFNRLRKDPTE